MENLNRQERQLLELKETPELGVQTLEMLCATGRASPAYMDAAGEYAQLLHVECRSGKAVT